MWESSFLGLSLKPQNKQGWSDAVLIWDIYSHVSYGEALNLCSLFSGANRVLAIFRLCNRSPPGLDRIAYPAYIAKLLDD